MSDHTEAEVAKARELLADAYAYDGREEAAEYVLAGHDFDPAVTRAVIAALRTASQDVEALHEESMRNKKLCAACGIDLGLPYIPASASEAIYQIECDGDWYYTSAEYFHGHDGSEKRILYTRPASAE